MNELRFAVLGAGFWSGFQLAAWHELRGARCVAIYNRTRSKAEALAARFGIAAVYDDAERLLNEQPIDFIDIITDNASHERFVRLTAAHGLPVICQKPLSESVRQAASMVDACRSAGVPLLVHENWRWQHPIRRLKAELDAGVIGRVFRARVTYSNSFPVFENQPFLRELERFILTDLGTHVLDTTRFLFGEVGRAICRTARVAPGIRGEDVATALLDMQNGTTVVCEISYASRMEHERFPQTFVLVEGSAGSIELAPDYWLRTTTRDGTFARRVPPPRYAWADPQYEVVHASIVECNRSLLGALRGECEAETTAEDNLKTLALVEACYASAENGRVVSLAETAPSAAWA